MYASDRVIFNLCQTVKLAYQIRVDMKDKVFDFQMKGGAITSAFPYIKETCIKMLGHISA